MSTQLGASSDFTENLAIHMALKAAMKSGQFEKSAAVRKAADRLYKDLEGESSIFGRQIKMIRMMEKGASIAELGRKLRCSRRTAFRYLNFLEDAGIGVSLEDGKYHVEKSVARMLR